MLKNIRQAAMAAVLLVIAAGAAISPVATAQTTPATTPSAAAPAAAPAPAAVPAPAAGKAPEMLDNPYGLEALWKGSDLVAKATLVILVIMSMGSWYIIITKLYEQHRMGQQAKDANKKFWKAPTVRQGAETLKKSSPYRFIAESGIEATQKHDGLLGSVDLNDWITMSIQRAIENVSARTQDGLAFLATVGSTAPFIGLFGTVWGIMNAFRGLANVAQATLANVAPGIAEALVATAIGLFAAIPAVIGYNRYTHDVDRLATRYETFIEEFSNILQRQS